MPSAPPSALPTAIPMAATRTFATARVSSAVKSGECCAAKAIPPNKTFALRMLQHPLRPAKQFPSNRINYRAPFAHCRSGGPGRLTQIEEARDPLELEIGFLEISCKIEQYKQIGFVK